MGANDNRDLSKSNNMLRSLIRTANYARAYKSTFNKIQPILSTAAINHFHATPVAALQQNLPKLPVPELQNTLEKYLRSIMPLASCDELQQTKCLVEEFGQKEGCGEKLQKLLQDKAKCAENWLEEWWLNAAYLGYRVPVVVHSSPGLVFPMEKFCNTEARLEYAARLIITSMKYKEYVDSEKMPVEKMGKDPLDMGQYKKFFGTCRIPKPKLDGLEFNEDSTHVVVACNNHFYKLTPVDECGNILSLKQITDMLAEVVDKSCEKAPGVGLLSSDHRDSWANTYKLLIKDPQNKKAVRAIQKSLFLVCLDQPMSSCGTDRLTLAGLQTIHGGGPESNSGNRWFDKTVQFIIGNDGIVGMTYEHSPSEGQPIAVMTDFLVNNIPKVDPCAPCAKATCLEYLEFNVDCELNKAIKCAGETLESLICDFDLVCTKFTDFGKNYIKSQKMSPDSFLQMAYQLAYYRVHCKPAAHYESAATRKFIGGRTETIRCCSTESLKFCQAMLECDMPAMDKRHLMEAAVNGHKKYTMEAVNGLGVDRHFLGMQLIAAENNIELPAFFSDATFLKSKHWNISSSQVATKCAGFMCYGPVVPDGYAICYNPRDDEIFWGVSCFNQDKSTSAKKLNSGLIQSLKEMREVLNKSQKAKM